MSEKDDLAVAKQWMEDEWPSDHYASTLRAIQTLIAGVKHKAWIEGAENHCGRPIDDVLAENPYPRPER